MKKKFIQFSGIFFRWFTKRYLFVISGVALYIILFEFFEWVSKNEQIGDPYHFIEILIYVFLLFFIGFLINYLIKIIKVQENTFEILNYKHRIGLDLINTNDWSSLIKKLVTLPSEIAQIDSSQLYIRTPNCTEIEPVIIWKNGNTFQTFEEDSECQNCIIFGKDNLNKFRICNLKTEEKGKKFTNSDYCLPIHNANQILALLRIKLQPGGNLSSQQIKVLDNIRPEMAFAIMVILEQMKYSELRDTQTALAERHSISNFLHDNLSQNLAYLCLKLGQLTDTDDLYSVRHLQMDLERLKDTANHSYEIVRGMIETIHPKTTPLLINLLSEYGEKISQRANFKISIKREGFPKALTAHVVQTIFNLYQELLSNIEKYAQADQVSVLIKWSENDLSITVADNGIGFDSENIDPNKHFGLEIMKERIVKLNGYLNIESTENGGTTTIFSIPLRIPVKDE